MVNMKEIGFAYQTKYGCQGSVVIAQSERIVCLDGGLQD